jgi:hypothetical protein
MTIRKIGDDFAFRLRLKNDLPPVPFDPLLLQYPHPVDRTYKYQKFTLLEKEKHRLIHPEGEQGLPCNMFDMGFLEREMKHPNGTRYN